MFDAMCKDLKQPDLITVKSAGNPAHNIPEEDFSLQNPQELFDIMGNRGLKGNHALILGVMLGLNKHECQQYLLKSRMDYKETGLSN